MEASTSISTGTMTMLETPTTQMSPYDVDTPKDTDNNIQSTSAVTEATEDIKKDDVDVNKSKEDSLRKKYSNDLKAITQLWLSSWFSKKQWCHMHDRSFWERVYRGVFWIAQNPYVSDHTMFVLDNDETNTINRSFIACPRLMDYIVYFMELIIHPEVTLDNPYTITATEDMISTILSRPKYIEAIDVFTSTINKIYQEAVKENIEDLQRIKDINIKNLFYAFVSLFEPRSSSLLEGETVTNKDLIESWNNIFLGIKKSLANVSDDNIGLNTLVDHFKAFRNSSNNNYLFGEIEERGNEAWQVTENKSGFTTWSMKEENNVNDDKDNIVGHAKLITESILRLAENIRTDIPHIKDPLILLRESLEGYHGAFDPFYLQLFRTQVKEVFLKDKNEIIFDPFAYKCFVDTFSELYDEFGPAVVDQAQFESNGFLFNLKYTHAFLKEVAPEKVEFKKRKKGIDGMTNFFDFTFKNATLNMMVEQFEYFKIEGFPLYQDKGEALLCATDIDYYLTLSVLNNDVKIENCKCKIGNLDIKIHKSTKNSLVNWFLKVSLATALKKKLQESLEQALWTLFTNIFL